MATLIQDSFNLDPYGDSSFNDPEHTGEQSQQTITYTVSEKF
ncbi:hypothetical protein [Neobacillus sp. Marseille-QA0830]